MQLLAAGKIRPYEGPILSGCRGFLVPEEKKRRLRIIFEPILNPAIVRDQLPSLAYPSRLQRRQSLLGCRYFGEYDMAAYFDQFQLADICRGYFVIRIGNEAFSLCQLPMGSTFSAHVAQTVTWAILSDIRKRYPNIVINSMIDNVDIASTDFNDFERASGEFEARCTELGLKLNDERTKATPGDEFSFLGEEYRIDKVNGCVQVRNSSHNVQKLREAYERLQQHIMPDGEGAPPYTPCVTTRQFIGILSLACWLAHTIGVPLRQWWDTAETRRTTM